jgi:hypothetical protein
LIINSVVPIQPKTAYTVPKLRFSRNNLSSQHFDIYPAQPKYVQLRAKFATFTGTFNESLVE